jgi:hypothetical protein
MAGWGCCRACRLPCRLQHHITPYCRVHYFCSQTEVKQREIQSGSRSCPLPPAGLLVVPSQRAEGGGRRRRLTGTIDWN